MVNAQKLYSIHRKNQNLKPLSMLSFTIQICESLTGVTGGDRLTNSFTNSSLPFTRANFHRCEKLIPADLNYSVIVLCVRINLNIPSKNLKKKE